MLRHANKIAVVVALFAAAAAVTGVAPHTASVAVTAAPAIAKAAIYTNPDPNGFSVVVLPDSQGETGGGGQPNYLGDEIDWIVAHAATYHIKMVISEGDFVGNPVDDTQWDSATADLDRLDSAGIPYLIAAGNHDNIVYHDNDPSVPVAKWVGTAIYDCHLPISRFQAMPTYGGAMPGGAHDPDPNDRYGCSGGSSESAADSYQIVNAGGMSLLAITVPFAPSHAELNWAASVIAAHPTSHVIFDTHDYLGDDNQIRGNRAQLLGYGEDSNPAYGNRAHVKDNCLWYWEGSTKHCVLEDALITNKYATPIAEADGRGPTNGLDAWKTVVAPNPNVQFVVSGHVTKNEHIDPSNGRPVKGPCTGAVAGKPGYCVPSNVDPANSEVAGELTSTRSTDSGSKAYQMMMNAQGVENTGGGYMRLMQFAPGSNQVDVDTISGSGFPALVDGSNKFRLTHVLLANPDGTPFWDVTDTNAFATDIYDLRARKVMNGNSDNTFDPAADISRQAAAEVAFRATREYQNHSVADRPSCNSGGLTSPFRDVPDSNPFCYAIAWLHAQGVVNGYADGGFHPGSTVSRQAVTAWLAPVACDRQGLGFSASVCRTAPAGAPQYFSDVPPGNPFYGQIEYLANHSVVSGYRGGTFHNGDPIERQATAAWVERTLTTWP